MCAFEIIRHDCGVTEKKREKIKRKRRNKDNVRGSDGCGGGNCEDQKGAGDEGGNRGWVGTSESKMCVGGI